MNNDGCGDCPLNAINVEKLKALIDAASLSQLISVLNEPEGLAPIIAMVEQDKHDRELMARVFGQTNDQSHE